MRKIRDSAIEEIEKELADAVRMYRKIAEDPRRKLDQPNEKLHYWDGKVTGLKLAIQIIQDGTLTR